MIDIASIRKDFPILNSSINGKKLCYLDSANTSLTPESVLEAMNKYYREYNANIHRGMYPISEKATEEHENARSKVASFISAKSEKEIVFTRNATEAINLIVHTWGKTKLTEKDTVVLSMMEHHSNIVPWQILQKELGFKIYYLGISEDGRLDLEELKKILKTETVKMISIVYESNVLGTINPIEEIIQLAHEYDATILIDGAQSAAHFKINVKDLDSDFFVFTGHKMYGPTGIGVLHAKKHWLEEIPPFLGGGEMIEVVTTDGSTWNDIPYKFEAGTPNISGAIGLGAAIDYLSSIGMENIEKREDELGKELMEKLLKISDLKIVGSINSEKRGAIFSFNIRGIHPHDLASIIGEKNICVRAGNHCAQLILQSFQITASTRVSLSFYNTSEDIDTLIKGIIEAKKIFKI